MSKIEGIADAVERLGKVCKDGLEGLPPEVAQEILDDDVLRWASETAERVAGYATDSEYLTELERAAAESRAALRLERSKHPEGRGRYAVTDETRAHGQYLKDRGAAEADLAAVLHEVEHHIARKRASWEVLDKELPRLAKRANAATERGMAAVRGAGDDFTTAKGAIERGRELLREVSADWTVAQDPFIRLEPNIVRLQHEAKQLELLYKREMLRLGRDMDAEDRKATAQKAKAQYSTALAKAFAKFRREDPEGKRLWGGYRSCLEVYNTLVNSSDRTDPEQMAELERHRADAQTLLDALYRGACVHGGLEIDEDSFPRVS